MRPVWKTGPCPSLVRKRRLSAAACWQLGPFILRPGSPRRGSRAALGPVLPSPHPPRLFLPWPEPPSNLPAGSFVAEARQACFCPLAQAAGGCRSQPQQRGPSHTPQPPPARQNRGSPSCPFTSAPEDKGQGTTGKQPAPGYTRGLNAGLTGPPRL